MAVRAPISPTVYRIQTRRLVLRCWQPTDAPALVESINASMDSLKPWLPWALNEPTTVPDKLKMLQQWRANFDRGGTLAYGIFPPDESMVLGAIGSHDRIGSGARELGYWIRKDHARQGLMTEAAGALTRIGFEIDGLSRIEVHCSPENVASAGVPRSLGFRHALTLANCVHGPAMKPRDTMIWTMLRSEYAGSPVSAMPFEPFDALNQPVQFAAARH